MNYWNLTINAVSAEQRKEVLIIKTTIHDIMNQMIRVCFLIRRNHFLKS